MGEDYYPYYIARANNYTPLAQYVNYYFKLACSWRERLTLIHSQKNKSIAKLSPANLAVSMGASSATPPITSKTL